MINRKVVILFTIIISIIIGVLLYIDFSFETERELQKRIEATMLNGEENQRVFDQINYKLESNGYEVYRTSLEFNPKDDLFILIEIPQKKNISNFNKIEENAKNITHNILKTSKLSKFNLSVKVRSIDIKQTENENVLTNVIAIIDKELKVQNRNYISIAYDINPEPTKIILNTSIKKSDKNANEKIKSIVKITNDIIKSSSENKLINEYMILVKGKNKENQSIILILESGL